jgi:hypothetical protein
VTKHKLQPSLFPNWPTAEMHHQATPLDLLILSMIRIEYLAPNLFKSQSSIPNLGIITAAMHSVYQFQRLDINLHTQKRYYSPNLSHVPLFADTAFPNVLCQPTNYMETVLLDL